MNAIHFVQRSHPMRQSPLSHNQCRFCDDRDQSMVKYGVRHYAHFECYLDAGKKLSDLHEWQIRQFPYCTLKKRNLLLEASRIISATTSTEP